jgi:rhomboid protease GluP
MRKTTGSMICPQCGKLIGVSEEKCPFCGAWNPSLYGYAPAMQRFFGMKLDLVPLITMACVVLYVISLVLQPEALLHPTGLFGLLSPGSRALYQLGMTGGLAWSQGWWWTVLSAIYLHGGVLHIFFNLMWVRNLGPGVVDAYGTARAFVIFTVAGALGFVVSNLASGTPTIGASGSIFGLLAALIVYSRKRGGSALTSQLWQWAILMFVMGFIMPSFNNWAHAGGFAGGYLVSAFFNPLTRERGDHMMAALVCLVVTFLAIGYSVINGLGLLYR